MPRPKLIRPRRCPNDAASRRLGLSGGFRFTTADLDDVVRSALTGMIQDTRQLKGA
jgi:hypothetical protein